MEQNKCKRRDERRGKSRKEERKEKKKTQLETSRETRQKGGGRSETERKQVNIPMINNKKNCKRKVARKKTISHRSQSHENKKTKVNNWITTDTTSDQL